MQSDGPTAGVDWASETHVGCVVGKDGAVLDRFEIAHDAAGLKQMVRRFRAAGAQDVAIERGDGPVVEVLLEAGVSVFVVPSRQIKSLRSRYGSAGNKDDRLDAYVLADTLRTDGHRWRALREDSDDTRALRGLCRARKDLVETRVQMLNQLRSNLELAFPGAVGSELLCLAVAQMLLGYHSERRWVRHAQGNADLRRMFPYLPQQPGYHKRLKASRGLLCKAIRVLAQVCPSWSDDLWITDATPVPCGTSRETVKRSDLAGHAGYGYCASYSRYYWGLKLYLVCAGDGMPIMWCLAHPKIGEREVVAPC